LAKAPAGSAGAVDVAIDVAADALGISRAIAMEGEERSVRPVSPVREKTRQTVVLKISIVRPRAIVAIDQMERIVALARGDVRAVKRIAMIAIVSRVAGMGRSLAATLSADSAAPRQSAARNTVALPAAALCGQSGAKGGREPDRQRRNGRYDPNRQPRAHR
jgi:hypothetical protein